MPKCIVSGCPNHTARKDKNISNGIMLHGFPKDLLRIKCWLSQIGQNFGDLESFARRILEGKKTNSFRICSEHFSPDSYRQTKRKTVLKDNAIPRHFHKNPPLSKAQSDSGNTISSAQPTKREACAPTCAVRKDVSACSDNTTDTRNTAKAFFGVQHRDVHGSPQAQPLLKMTPIDNSHLHKTDRILSLTLQILFLLTGEDYTVVKKTSADHITSSSPTESGGRSVARETDPMPTTDYVSHEKNKEILQLTNQIIRLLTGEVPARCQDIAVYFSVEEWDYVDKHKSLYKNIIVDDQQSLYKNIIVDDQQSLYKNIIMDDQQSLYKNIIMDDQQSLYKNIILDDQQNLYKNIILDDQQSLYKNIILDDQQSLYKKIILDDQQNLYKNIILDDQQNLYKNIILDDQQNLYKNIILDDQQSLYKNIVLDDQQSLYKNIVLDDQQSLYKNIVMDNRLLLPQGEQPVLTPKPEKRDDFIEEPLNGFNITAVKSLTGGDYISFDLTKEEPVSVDSMDGDDRISTAQELWSSECGDEPVSTPEHEIEIVIEDDFIGEPLNDFYTTTINSPAGGDDVLSDLGKPEPVAADRMNRDDSAAQKPLSCSECGKCFRYPSRLIEHERVHTGEKPFSCPECGKCFIWKSLLVQHTKIHTGEHQCLFCRKCFTNKAKLIDHQRTHTGERPFTCNLCRKSFGLKTSLTKHQRLHMREKLLCCSECGKCFMQESNLYRHQRTHMCQQPL